MENYLDAPHPHLTTPTLYSADVAERIEWSDLEKAFKSCGTIESHERHPSKDPSDGDRLEIRFSTVYEAEMALATLSGTYLPNVWPPFMLKLSPSSDEKDTLPSEESFFSQFVHTDGHDHPLYKYTAQELFRYFRHAGPLSSVRTTVDIGRGWFTCVVEYFETTHANYARLNAQVLAQGPNSPAPTLPPFSLRTYNPRKLYCTRLGPAVGAMELHSYFKKEYTGVLETEVQQKGTPAAHGFVLFRTKDEATKAMFGMRGKVIDGYTMEVRYHVPIAQDIFCEARTSPKTSTPSTEQDKDLPPRAEPETTLDAAALEAKQKEEDDLKKKREAEAAASRLAERRSRRDAALARRKAAEAEAKRSRGAATDAGKAHDVAKTQKAAASRELETSMRGKTEAADAVAEAERALKVAREHYMRAMRRATAAAQGAAHAVDREVDTRNQMNEALEGRRWAEAEQDRVYDETQADLDDTADLATPEQRQQELAQSIRKMKEIQEAEAAYRRKKEERERAEQAERERVEQAERERKAREAAEKMAREKRERDEREAARQKAYLNAAENERFRCMMRDAKKWQANRRNRRWSSDLAIRRFEAVSLEFDELKFSENQPLTFESVPWPVLHNPSTLRPEKINWDAVERFFRELQRTAAETEYKAVVEKAHRRFHPDKWRARGILRTVLDETLRKQLEDAGNIVAQALTPIWRASKSESPASLR